MKKKYNFNETEVIESYLSGKSVIDLTKYYKCSQTPIREILIKNNVKVHDYSTFQRKLNGYTLNETVFDELNEYSEYWLGFLMADGNVDSTSNAIKIKLKSSDIDHLIKFKTFVNGNHKIRSDNTEKHFGSVFSFSSKYIKNVLINYGITPRKSKTAVACESLSKSKHFWRGVIDGDGYLGFVFKNKKLYLSFKLVSGSSDLINQFIQFVKLNLDIDLKLKQQDFSKYKKNGSILYSAASTYSKAVTLINFLYKDAEVYLDRKYKLAESVFNSDLIKHQTNAILNNSNVN